MIRPGAGTRPAVACRHLVLVGLPYSGKTTVGERAAACLGLPFVDTDQEVERRAGLSIPDIFRQQGELAFRALERQAVAAAVAGPPRVIATGGGAPVDDENRRLLWAGNLVVFLDTSPGAIMRRLRRGAGHVERPLLAGDEPLQRLLALSEQRRAVYEQAHVVIQTDAQSVDETARAVCQAFCARVGGVGGSQPSHQP